MNEIVTTRSRTDTFDQQRVLDLAQLALVEARKLGATAAEAGVAESRGLSVAVRQGEIDTLEHHRDGNVAITVYKNKSKGSASTTDLSPAAVKAMAAAACSIAGFTAADEYSGLADPAQLATTIPDLDLYHPWPISAEQAIELARTCEAAAFAVDKRISNSEGAMVTTSEGIAAYANTHGFAGSYMGTRHMLSCAVIAAQGDEMQSDYWYTRSRMSGGLEPAESIGRRAAECALKRLGARRIRTRQAPVLYAAEIAGSLLGNFLNAIQGSVLYRGASFLLDQKGKQIFPADISLQEQPHILAGMASAPYDDEGVATRTHDIVRDGVLLDYMLDSYSARKLGMTTTGNAGGVRNLVVQSPEMKLDLSGLIEKMHTGLLVTRLMGHGINIVTGDYSRGAGGFWVENGEIQYPVDEITIAGNLQDMLRNIAAVGRDLDRRGSILTGSILVESMTIAGE
ncbi:MAG TPA: metalloprotease PmbA [Gammaproteobacteria bacterium]